MKILPARSRMPWLLVVAVMTAHSADRALTLEDAVAFAVRNAPQVTARQAAIEGAQAMAISAGRLPDPDLVVGVDNLPTNGPDAYSFGSDFMTMRKVGVMQGFPSGRKRAAQRQQAQASVSVAESEGAQARLAAAQSAADAWVSVHVAEVALQSLQELNPELALQAEAGRAAVAGDRATVYDAMSAQAAVADLDDRILRAGRDVAVPEPISGDGSARPRTGCWRQRLCLADCPRTVRKSSRRSIITPSPRPTTHELRRQGPKWRWPAPKSIRTGVPSSTTRGAARPIRTW